MTDQQVQPEEVEVQPTLEDALQQASQEAQPDYQPPEVEVEVPEEIEVEETTDQAAPAGWIDVEGVGRIRQEDLAKLARTQMWISENPDEWQALVDDYERRLSGTYQPAEVEEDPDEYVDPDIAALRAEVAEIRNEAEGRHRREVARAVNRAAADFLEAHPDVDENQMNQMWMYLARGEGSGRILHTYVDDHDDEYKGTRAGLEDAYKILTYDQARTDAARDVVSQMRSRRNAAAASTRERSSSRSMPVPTNPQERDAAMVAELREAMQQEATQ